MPVESIDHVNIVCADLERTRAFYCDVLGLTVGPRPAVGIAGYWLYCDGKPQVHLIDGRARGMTAPAQTTKAALDHVAFRVSDADAMAATLKRHDIGYSEHVLSGFGIRQLVVYDPEGVKVELNCMASGS